MISLMDWFLKIMKVFKKVKKKNKMILPKLMKQSIKWILILSKKNRKSKFSTTLKVKWKKHAVLGKMKKKMKWILMRKKRALKIWITLKV